MVNSPCLLCEKPVKHPTNVMFVVTSVTVGYTFVVTIVTKKHIKIKKDFILWYCKSCLKKEISFFDLHDIGFSAFTDRMFILPKKNICESKIVEKLNTFTENEDRKCKYYMHDQTKYIRLRKT